MSRVDEYIANTIKKGDEGSKLLAALCAPTLKFREEVDIIKEGMNGVAVLRVPQGMLVAAHSVGGNYYDRSFYNYVASAFGKAVQANNVINGVPIAFADVIDANNAERDLVKVIGNTLVSEASHLRVPIINGELADLGARVNPHLGASLALTTVSLVSKKNIKPGVFSRNGIQYAIFDPKGKAVWMNSDGIGTKTEFYERAGKEEFGYNDSLAMKVDDTIKIGATPKVVSDVVETRGEVPFNRIRRHATRLGNKLGILTILQREEAGDRIRGYSDTSPAYNISGTVVSTIDESWLRNPPHPSPGEALIAIRGEPNPRSNGITAKRKLMIKLFGENWHKTPEGNLFMNYLASPSIVLYPVFRDLMDDQLASSVYHLSGGAWEGKLARPLAKHGLGVTIENQFAPDWREVTLAAHSLSARDSYAKWPMGTDGFVTTSKPGEAIDRIRRHGLEAKEVGTLRRARTNAGVNLTAYNGEKIRFSGKD